VVALCAACCNIKKLCLSPQNLFVCSLGLGNTVILQPEWTFRFLLWWRVCFLWIGNLIFVYIIQMYASLRRDNAFLIWDFMSCYVQYQSEWQCSWIQLSVNKINCFVLPVRRYVGLDYFWFWFWLSVVGRTRNEWNWTLVPRSLVVTSLLSAFLCHYEVGMRQAASHVRQDVYLPRVRTIHRFGMGQSALLLSSI